MAIAVGITLGEHSAVPSCHMARSSHSRAAFVGEWRIWLLPRRALFHRLRSTPGLGLRRPAAFGPAARLTYARPVSQLADDVSSDPGAGSCGHGCAHCRNGSQARWRQLGPTARRYGGTLMPAPACFRDDFLHRTRFNRSLGCSVPMHSSASSATTMNAGGSRWAW